MTGDSGVTSLQLNFAKNLLVSYSSTSNALSFFCWGGGGGGGRLYSLTTDHMVLLVGISVLFYDVLCFIFQQELAFEELNSLATSSRCGSRSHAFFGQRDK